MQEVVKKNLKTTSEEWQRFERVIAENGPFDIVMDGLNVAYTPIKNELKEFLRNKSSTYGQRKTRVYQREGVEGPHGVR